MACARPACFFDGRLLVIHIVRGGWMEADLEKIWGKIKDKKNVIGYSGSMKRRIRDGKEIAGTWVLRVYVTKKEPVGALDPVDVIPRMVDRVEIDLVEIGEIKALKKEDKVIKNY